MDRTKKRSHALIQKLDSKCVFSGKTCPDPGPNNPRLPEGCLGATALDQNTSESHVHISVPTKHEYINC
jgi:hypothetical protein